MRKTIINILNNSQSLTENLKIGDINQSQDLGKIHDYFYNTYKFTSPVNFNNVDILSSQEIIDCEGYKFVTMRNDTCVSNSLRENKLFEKFFLSFIGKIIPKNKNMLDIGANIGVWSTTFRSLIDKENIIHAFEPQYEIYDCLVKNVILNNLNNVITYNFALSNIDENKFMNANYESKDNFGAFRIIDDIVDNTSATLQIDCKVGDSLNITNVGFIKIDVEGHEYEVLTGLTVLILKNKPFIFIEIHNNEKTANQTINLLYKFGYKNILRMSHCDYLALP